MIKAILSYLKSDSELSSLLQSTSINPKIYPFEHSNTSDDPYIVYNYHPVIAEAITQYRLELRVVTKDFLKMEAVGKKLMKLMNFVRKPGFIEKGETIYHSAYVGGGKLKDPDDGTYHQILIFNVKSI